MQLVKTPMGDCGSIRSESKKLSSFNTDPILRLFQLNQPKDDFINLTDEKTYKGNNHGDHFSQVNLDQEDCVARYATAIETNLQSIKSSQMVMTGSPKAQQNSSKKR